MGINDTLVVPVEVAAFAVNAQTRDADGTYVMQRWIANFAPLVADNAAPEPLPFSGTEQWTGDASRLGVYVQWQLPEALTRGHQDSVTGEIGDFPLVPNRWLVTRRSGSGVRTWIVHSDYLDPAHGTVSCLDPHAAQATATKLGRLAEITPESPWAEPGDAPFLTALGPGLLTFSVYQPYNQNVFSIHDTLADITGDDRIGYHVAGWYSSADADILAAGEHANLEFQEVMSRLEWSLAAAYGSPQRSVYTGSAIGIDWRPGGDVYPSDSPRAADIAVAIGNSTAEAAGVLQEQTGGTDSLSAEAARLYSAFTLGVLDEYGRADGELFPERAAHESGFATVPGGFTWRLVDRSAEQARAALSPAQRSAEQARGADVVAELNERQRHLDERERELAALRQHLHVVWSLSLEPSPPDSFERRIADELDPANPAGAAGRTAALHTEVAQLRTQIPWATTEDELAARAAAYAAEKGLRAGLELRRAPEPPFLLHAYPGLLLAGASLHAPLTRGSELPCRVAETLVAYVGEVWPGTVAADVANINVSGLPGPMESLVTEFCMIDEAHKTGVPLSEAYGTLPEYGTSPWRQAWQPLYLMWEAEYTAIPFVEDTAERWNFDGIRYRWEGEGQLTSAITVSGRQMLAPTSGYDQDGKLDSYVNGRDDLPADALAALHRQLEELDQLSQRLDGLSAAVGQRLSGVAMAPTGELGELIADGAGLAPDPGAQPEFEWDDFPPSNFQELRAGHLMFTRLSVVDRFGRAVNLIDNPLHFNRLRKPPSMTPDHAVGEIQTDRYAELGPRLLQPARLRFDFLSATGDSVIDVTPGANPICAWLVRNRLDRSLACYSPEGKALGDLRVVLGPDSQRTVEWTALPDSPILEFDSLATDYPHAHHFLDGVKQAGRETFETLLDLIDDALTVIDPDGPEDRSLGFLLGRPLALVRARLDLALHGPARTDVTWEAVLDPPAPKMPSYRWNVRLGEAEQTDDGLVGYVVDNDYAHFETVLEPPGSHDGYLRPIGDGDSIRLSFAGDSNATVTLLLDPRAAVHATTDILPVTSVFVPQQFAETALAEMAVNFRSGPLLIATTDDGAATLPRPATVTGTWSWAERHGPEWAHMDIAPPDPASLPIGANPEIRSGFLVLNDAAQHSRSAHPNGQGAW